MVMNTTQLSFQINDNVIHPNKVLTTFGGFLPDLILTFQWPITPPTIRQYFGIVAINVLFKKGVKTFRTSLFDHFGVGTNYFFPGHFSTPITTSFFSPLLRPRLFFSGPPIINLSTACNHPHF